MTETTPPRFVYWQADETVITLDRLAPGDLVTWRDTKSARYVKQIGIVHAIDDSNPWFKVFVFWPNASADDGVFNAHPYEAVKKL